MCLRLCHTAALGQSLRQALNVIDSVVRDEKIEKGIFERHIFGKPANQLDVLDIHDFLFPSGAFHTGMPRIDAVDARARTEPHCQFDQRKPETETDIERPDIPFIPYRVE